MHREAASWIFPAWDKMELRKADATAHETDERVKETYGIGEPLDNFEYGGQAILAKTVANVLLASSTEDPLSAFFGLPDKIVDDGVSDSTGSLASSSVPTRLVAKPRQRWSIHPQIVPARCRRAQGWLPR